MYLKLILQINYTLIKRKICFLIALDVVEKPVLEMINRSLKLNAPSIWEEELYRQMNKIGYFILAMGHKVPFPLCGGIVKCSIEL